MRFFSRKPDEADGPTAAEVYLGLREQALGLTAEQLGLPPDPDRPILALVMETGYLEAVVTLVGVVDGTASLYFSNGGGVIGAGEHEPIAAATARWLEAGARQLSELAPLADPGTPAPANVQLIAVTIAGLVGAQAPEAELATGGHPLSPLFLAAHDVITQIRLVQEG